MFGITDLATYLIGTIFIVLLRPAPIRCMSCRLRPDAGSRQAIRGLPACLSGDTVLMVLSATGMAAMLKVYRRFSWGLKAAGAACLGWGRLHMLLSAWRS